MSYSSETFVNARLAASPSMLLNNLSSCDGRLTYSRRNAVRDSMFEMH